MRSSGQSEGQGLPCPRCDSRETKFCYFNNYSTAQPRHFCRNCKRYWTAGGTLRSVPVGGGLRKHKRSKLAKHGKDLLSAYTDESLSQAGNCTTLVNASPSSSADGIVDEKPVVALPVYCPTFDTDAGGEALVVRDSRPFSSSPFECMNVANFVLWNDALLAEGNEQHMQDANYGLSQPQFSFGCVDQSQSSSSEISLEPSQAGAKGTAPPAIDPLNRYNENEHQANRMYAGFRQNCIEFAYVNKQANLQCSADKHILAHNGNSRKTASTEDADAELGDVINVRYPYDWEQVSEVLFGGTPDFFHMPTF